MRGNNYSKLENLDSLNSLQAAALEGLETSIVTDYVIKVRP